MSKISRLLNLDYRIERKIIAGKMVRPLNNHPSVLFFTIHKAASFYVNGIMRRLMKANRFIPANLESYSFQHQSQVIQIQSQHFQPIGIYYGALRRRVQIEPDKNVKIVVQVRDPRDAITSSYFSFSNSHEAPVHEERKQAFEKNRAALTQTEIDQYAIDASLPLANKLRHYESDLLDRDQVLVMHYEDMVQDFEGWFDTLLDFLDLPASRRTDKTVTQIKNEANFSVKSENKGQHKRQVVPGDHLRKLKPETIVRLNETFSPYFESLTRSGQLPTTYDFPGARRKAA